jgi:competence ComEA-like helix-hairpin-helix protein
MGKQIEYGYFLTRRERRGITILSLMIFGLILYRTIRPNIDLNHTKPIDWDQIQHITERKPAVTESTEDAYSCLENFDPNQVTIEELISMGLSKQVAKNIVNYREKIGKFKSADDLKRIYTLKDEDFQKLKPYIRINEHAESAKKQIAVSEMNAFDVEDGTVDPNLVDSITLRKLGLDKFAVRNLMRYRAKGGIIYSQHDLERIYGMDSGLIETLSSKWTFPEKESKQWKETKFVQPEELIFLDINAATVPEWQYLSGIGPGYATRIVNYREKLGGFIRIEQVAETYQLPDTLFEKIKPFLKIQSAPRKITINTCSKEDLSKHPYVSFKQADLLINYREHHGSYKSAEDMKKILVLDAEWINKISPYLDFKQE